MEDIGDLIYVIAIIGYIIYSFISGAKKQKNKRKTVDETTSRPSTGEPDIKTVLEELLGKVDQSRPEPDPVYETSDSTIEPVYNEEGQSQEGKALNPVENYEFGKYRTLESEVEDEVTVASKYEQFNSFDYSEQTAAHSIAEKEGIKEVVYLEEEKELNPILKDFDIEKAIIYSEILNRPKWAA